jgi:3-hydroxy-5-methyl-1-naphthoate 3-O-methyltransferase
VRVAEHCVEPTTNSKPPSPVRIVELTWGFAPLFILKSALDHGVFDALDTEPKTIEELCEETAASERGLRAIVNGLVGLRFLTKQGSGRLSLTPESAAFLVSSRPEFHGGIISHAFERRLPRWLEISEVVGNGHDHSNGDAAGSETDGGYFAQWVEALFPICYAGAQALADALKLSMSYHPIKGLDIAAGSGVWGIGLAQASQQVEITAVDLPAVIEVTRRVVARHGLTKQFRFVEGDIFAGADFGTSHRIAVLGHILHSLSQQQIRILLRRTFDALAPGGSIAIAEFLVDKDRTGPLQSLIFAVSMMVHSPQGDTYSFEEIAEWLGETGFVNIRSLGIPGSSPLILATKPHQLRECRSQGFVRAGRVVESPGTPSE